VNSANAIALKAEKSCMPDNMSRSFLHDMPMKLKHVVSERLANIHLSGRNNMFGPDAIEQLNRTGLFQVDGFVKRETCQELIRQFAALETERPDLIAHESNGSDSRIYGADRVAPIFGLTEETSALDRLAEQFYRTRAIPHFQMVGHIQYRPGNLGSGSGWHRDSPFSQQFKYIVYLSDVTEQNGPFQYMPGSHRRETIERLSKYLGRPLSQYRFQEDDISALEKGGVLAPRVTVTGPAGTLLVANVKGLHRGKPLERGERWAVTRYYYRKRIPPEMEKLLPPSL
jgi:hypothetical protein